MTFRSRIWQYIKYNACVMPIIFAIYVPYNLFFIGYTPFQLVKWLSTAAILSFAVNLILQPYQSFLYKRKILK